MGITKTDFANLQTFSKVSIPNSSRKNCHADEYRCKGIAVSVMVSLNLAYLHCWYGVRRASLRSKPLLLARNVLSSIDGYVVAHMRRSVRDSWRSLAIKPITLEPPKGYSIRSSAVKTPERAEICLMNDHKRTDRYLYYLLETGNSTVTPVVSNLCSWPNCSRNVK